MTTPATPATPAVPVVPARTAPVSVGGTAGPVTPSPAATPAPGQPPAPGPFAPVRNDVHQIANGAKDAFNAISAKAKADFGKLLHDIEHAEGTSVDAIRKLFGI